jgi:serine/threonine protein kinase
MTTKRNPVCPKCGRTVAVFGATCPSCQAIGMMIDNRYKVTAELGQGQFGIVYRADDQRLPRTVAIKMLRQEALGSEDAVRRFQEEARILCQVNHPHVLPVFDQGQHEGKHYIAFAFIEGRTVKDLIDKSGPMDPARACRLAARLTSALHYVYAKHKILHRDVKPANMMLADGDENALYLMDFGLAVCHQADVTRQTVDGTIMGTPAYMSPEQARGKIVETSHRSDLYSSAVVLFQLLTGRVPFTTPWPGLVVDIIQTQPPAPSAVRPGLDPRLDAIVLKGLAKDANQRYQTGKEFADVLEQWATSPRAAVAVPAPAGAPRVVVRPLSPPTMNQPPSAELPNQGSSVVAGTTVNNPKPKPVPVPPPAAPAVAQPGQPPRVVVRPVQPPAAPQPPPPVAPAPQVAQPMDLPDEEPLAFAPGRQQAAPQPERRWLGFNLMITLAALGILLVGVGAVIFALKSGKKSDPPTTHKSGNTFRDAPK